jgi:hypothetical protein
MGITNKREVIFVVIGLVTAFAFGYYFGDAPVQRSTETKTKRETQVEEKKNVQTHTTTTTTKSPTGAVTTTTVTDTSVVAIKDTDTRVENSTTSTENSQKRSKVSVQALLALDLQKGIQQPIYGIAAQKEFIGPITLGAFGLTNGVIGVSIGLNF